jgi:hypothetical protein
MNPSRVERELRNALSVDPSAGFAAGVRARIGAAPEPVEQPRFGWWMPAAAAAVATVALIVGWRSSRAPAAPPRPQLLSGRSTISTTTLPPIASSSVHRAAPAAAVVRARVAGEAKVVISVAESRALLKLIAGPRTWQLDPAPVPITTAPPVADLVIEPIVIAPLSADGGQGVRQ